MTEAFQSFRDVIDAWPSRRDFRADLEAADAAPRSATQVRIWHHRDHIPAENFAAIAKAARRRRIDGLNLTQLRAIARRPGRLNP